MKKLSLMLFVITIMFNSCDSNPLELPWKTTEITEEPKFNEKHTEAGYVEIPQIRVYKIKQREYAQYAMLEENGVDTWHLRGENSIFRAPVNSGENPFVEVSAGYFILDWRWSDFFIYDPRFMSNIRWTDFQSWNQQWNDSEVEIIHDENIIEEKYFFTYEWLDWYSGKTEVAVNPYTQRSVNKDWYPGICFNYYENSKDWTNEEKKMVKQSVIEENRRFQEYIEIVNYMINKQELESIYQKYKK